VDLVLTDGRGGGRSGRDGEKDQRDDGEPGPALAHA
jgi:hypothetical protein